MESTGIYWIPIWRILQGYFELKLINSWFIKQLPGRETDVKDAEWIATFIQKSLVSDSYVAGWQIQELRQFERRYVSFVNNRPVLNRQLIVSFTGTIYSYEVSAHMPGPPSLLSAITSAKALLPAPVPIS